MPVVGAKPRIKFRGNIRHDLLQVRNFIERLLAQDVNAKGAPFLVPADRVVLANASTLASNYLAQKTP